MTIGNRIRKAREAKGYSQECMAIQLDLTQSGYRKIETDEVRIRVDVLLLLADLLEVKVVQLLYVQEQRGSATCNALPVQTTVDVERNALKQILECKEAQLLAQQKLISQYERQISELRMQIAHASSLILQPQLRRGRISLPVMAFLGPSLVFSSPGRPVHHVLE
jgi:transcriptional regulator with XRE-family HTH domain